MSQYLFFLRYLNLSITGFIEAVTCTNIFGKKVDSQDFANSETKPAVNFNTLTKKK